MLKLAARVHRIGIDDDQAGTHGAKQCDGVLQDVRHHQCDAVALDQAFALKPSGEIPRQAIQFRVRQFLVKIDISCLTGKAFATLVENIQYG